MKDILKAHEIAIKQMGKEIKKLSLNQVSYANDMQDIKSTILAQQELIRELREKLNYLTLKQEVY